MRFCFFTKTIHLVLAHAIDSMRIFQMNNYVWASQVIISRIAELKQAGVWKDFTAGSDANLARRTLIYGFNGAGKTTLSRIFSSIQRGSLEDRLPPETIFRIETSDGTVITQDSTSTPFNNNLLIFNRDFISRNLQWDASKATGIAYLSEKKVDAKKEFDALTPQLEAAKKTVEEKNKTNLQAKKAISDFKTRVARNIREVASSSTYTQSYDARKIDSHYSKSSFGADQTLPIEEFQNYQSILNQREPLPRIDFSPSLPNGLVEWFKAAHSLLTQSLPSIALKEFEAH